MGVLPKRRLLQENPHGVKPQLESGELLGSTRGPAGEVAGGPGPPPATPAPARTDEPRGRARRNCPRRASPAQSHPTHASPSGPARTTATRRPAPSGSLRKTARSPASGTQL